MKSCSIIVNGKKKKKLIILNFIFQYLCNVYKLFYDFYVMVLNC